MIKPYTEQEYYAELSRRSSMVDGEPCIDLEQLREMCFDVRLTEEQHQRVMQYVRKGDRFIESGDPGEGVMPCGDRWEYKRVHD